jgi:hypothetical protein
MEIITQNFTYDLPDIYLGTTTDDGLTGTVSYHGPDSMWVFVNAATGKLNWGMHCIIDHDDTTQDLAITHAGEDHRPILINFTQSPLICWAMWGEYDEENASEKTYTLDGASEPYYTHYDPIPPHEVYNYDEFTYLFDSASWKTPFPMRTPQNTEEQWDELFAEQIADVQEHIDASDVNAEYTAQLVTFKAELEALATTYADVPWYMWPMPEAPAVIRDDPQGEVVNESERMIGDAEWDSAEDGSEGSGAGTNYQPAETSTNMLPDDKDADSKPAPESDSLDNYTDDGDSGDASGA